MTKKRKLRFPKCAVTATAALLLVLAMCLPAGAMTVISRTPAKIGERGTDTYAEIPVQIENGSITAYLVNETTMVPLRAFYDCFLPGARIEFDAKTRTATVQGGGLTLQVTDGSCLLYANRRVLYADTPSVILDDGRIYVPVRLLAKTLGLDVAWDGAARSVAVTGDAVPLEDGATYYDADELYWLSRIISAESRGEPFLGQVAVGNVVQNRVRSRQFPNTVYGVIFDRKYGVQFTPTANGAIWKTPAAVSVTAAKVCLEGYTVTEEALYFVDLAIATSFWVPQNRPYLFKIGGHSFYG